MGLTRPRAYQIFDLDYKQAVRVVITTNVTLSGGTPASVDGVSLSANDRVLVTGQSTGSENGLYYVTVVGSGNDGTWARSIDGDQTGEIDAGLIVMVTEGATYADTQWKLTTDGPITVGTTPLTFVLNAVSVVGGLTTQIQYNNGGVLAGTANLTWSNSELYVNGTANVTGNITGNYFIGNGSQLTGVTSYTNADAVAYGEAGWAGNIIPAANVTYSLVNLSNQWKDVFVGPGSLYINGQKVLEESAGTILVTADQDQGVTVKTTGTGVTTVQSDAGVSLVATGSSDISITTATGQFEINSDIIIDSTKTINSSNASPIVFGDSIALNNNDISNVGSLTASGNITGSYFIGNGYSLTSINSSNISGTVANATYATSAGSATTAGTVTTAAQPNITSVGTLTTLTTSGQILLSSSTGRVLSGVDAGGSISLGLNDGNSSSPYLDFNTSNTAVDFNVRIQATGASAGTAGGNLYFYGAHFNYSNANIVIADTTSTAGSRNNFRITNSPYAFGILGRAGPGNYNPIVANNDVVLYSSNTSSQGNSSITLTTWANVEGGINVKSTNQLTDITIRGNTVSFYGDIVNGQANGVGNIGNATTYFNTVFAKATSAQYADVAEFYRADADYPVGTVLEFGGNQEVTAAVSNHTTAVAGTVSESPAVIMNSGLQHEHRTAVALLGRVPCRVVGSIQKGDRLAASHLPGVATALDLSHYQPGCIIGKALENYDSDEEGVIEIVVGRL